MRMEELESDLSFIDFSMQSIDKRDEISESSLLEDILLNNDFYSKRKTP